MRKVRATEARAQLAQLLRAVERGERFAILRHGRVIAHLVRAADADDRDRRAAIARFHERRARWERAGGFGTEEILAARHEGHRA